METIEIERAEVGRNVWIRGEKPRWKIGDCLYEYETIIEVLLGKIIDVQLEENCDDWKYTFDNGKKLCEQILVIEHAYEKPQTDGTEI